MSSSSAARHVALGMFHSWQANLPVIVRPRM
jgi:hypothetical protein